MAPCNPPETQAYYYASLFACYATMLALCAPAGAARASAAAVVRQIRRIPFRVREFICCSFLVAAISHTLDDRPEETLDARWTPQPGNDARALGPGVRRRGGRRRRASTRAAPLDGGDPRDASRPDRPA